MSPLSKDTLEKLFWLVLKKDPYGLSNEEWKKKTRESAINNME